MWILIIVISAMPVVSGTNGISVNMHEFESENTCQIAAKQFKEQFKKISESDINARAICVKK